MSKPRTLHFTCVPVYLFKYRVKAGAKPFFLFHSGMGSLRQLNYLSHNVITQQDILVF